jgi:hypothetical protein
MRRVQSEIRRNGTCLIPNQLVILKMKSIVLRSFTRFVNRLRSVLSAKQNCSRACLFVVAVLFMPALALAQFDSQYPILTSTPTQSGACWCQVAGAVVYGGQNYYPNLDDNSIEIEDACSATPTIGGVPWATDGVSDVSGLGSDVSCNNPENNTSTCSFGLLGNGSTDISITCNGCSGSGCNTGTVALGTGSLSLTFNDEVPTLSFSNAPSSGSVVGSSFTISGSLSSTIPNTGVWFYAGDYDGYYVPVSSGFGSSWSVSFSSGNLSPPGYYAADQSGYINMWGSAADVVQNTITGLPDDDIESEQWTNQSNLLLYFY